MSVAYQYVLKQLCMALDMPEPQEFDEVTSLQVGEHVCHLTEHPTDHLLIFTRIEPTEGQQAQEQNLFSQELCKPTLGLDAETDTQVLWNRQSLLQMDRAMIHHQLEMLIEAAERLSTPAD